VTLAAGTRLGVYEIAVQIGEGGMGQVYRATDTRLKRQVAIKVLPPSVAGDADRLARFRREAEVLASLNHPNIAHIFGLEGQEGRDAQDGPFLVLELVEGPTLAERIAQGPLPIDEALRVARQIAEALEAAHEQGIIHRDLKPANVKVKDDGTVKLLDFGLAKALDSGAAKAVESGGLSMSPTLSIHATQAGIILGTAAYMSPEQAKGRPTDKRTDVWAFGCVLYEMLTGRRAFEGDDVSDTLAVVLRGQPEWSALPPDVSPALRSILERCLAKERSGRIPDLSVVRYLMADAAADRPAAPSAAPRSGFKMALIASVAAIAAAAVAAAVVWSAMRARPASPERPARFALALPGPLVLGPDRAIVLTPDGRHVVSVIGASAAGGGQLMVRSLNELDAQPIKGVTGARAPFVSPDSRWIGYFDQGELKKVPLTGGPPITMCRVSGGTRGSTWGPDNTIVYATNDATTGLVSVSAGGGEPTILTRPDPAHGELDHLFPSFLPGGRAILFTIATSGSADSGVIAALDLKTGQRKTLVRGGSFAEYSPTGHLLYASGGSVRAVRFDVDRLEVSSDPVVVLDQVQTESSGAAQFSVAPTGALVYEAGDRGTSFDARTLVWVDRAGREQPLNTGPRAYLHPRLSPDGSRIAVSMADQDQDIYIFDIARRMLTPLTFGPASEQFPIWTPDGRHVLFRSDRAGIPNLFWQAPDGTGSAEQLTTFSQQLVVPAAITPDGTTLVVQVGTHLGIIRIGDREKVATLLDSPGVQTNAALSADGRWLAYNSTESGTSQIFVRPFPDVDAGRWQISTEAGTKPTWARNGQEIFYLSVVGGSMMTVPVRTTGGFSYDRPTKLFDGRPYYATPANRTYDVAADGKRFLMIRLPAIEAVPETKIVLVLNWFEELKARVPGK